MTEDERREIRSMIDQRVRELLADGEDLCPIGYGNETGYRRGCRCVECRAASAAGRRARWGRDPDRNRKWREQRRQRRARLLSTDSSTLWIKD